jgi:hypothetical protein
MSTINLVWLSGVLNKSVSTPKPPKGGFLNNLDFNKSPLGVPIVIGIGVSQRKLTFSTALRKGCILKKETNKIYLR